MTRIQAIYRPVLDTAWTAELERAATMYGNGVTIFGDEDLMVSLIKPEELAAQDLRGDDAATVEAKLRRYLPRTFDDPATVVTRGLTYVKRPEPLWPLIVKIGGENGDNFDRGESQLMDDNDGIFDGLAQYNVQPMGSAMRFQSMVGGMAVRMFDGPARESLRLSLSHWVPKQLVLGPGVILMEQ